VKQSYNRILDRKNIEMDLKKMKNKKRIVSLLGVLVVIGLLYCGVLQFKIYQYSQLEVPKKADYLIVLGARVKGTVPSLSLKSRIQAAANYLNENKKTIVIASGGKGSGEKISEAESIKRELMKNGISHSRIILEDRSTDTYENIKFSKMHIPHDAKRGVVVTNAFHVYRAIMIAKDQGLHLYGIPTKTPLLSIPKSYIREYLAITKYYLVKYILK
jgi:uncharacterized SAM-binding protein YcdF (DUF218 family)